MTAVPKAQSPIADPKKASCIRRTDGLLSTRANAPPRPDMTDLRGSGASPGGSVAPIVEPTEVVVLSAC
ncbi:hypothetical protein GCM10009795_043930 [Nocardioides hankookensis]